MSWSLECHDIFGPCSLDRLYRNGLIKGYELPAMPNRKREEVQIGQLARAVNARSIDDFSIKQADVVRPEFVKTVRSRFPKALHDRGHGWRIRVAWVRHDAHAPILGDRTGGPPGPRVVREPLRSAAMQRMIPIEQSDQHIDV